MKKYQLLVPIVAISILFVWQYFVKSGESEIFRESRISMGTLVEITAAHGSERRAREAIRAAFEEIDRIDRVYGQNSAESMVSRINRESFSHPVTVDPEMIGLLRTASLISRDSQGAFDMTIGPLMKLWRFDSGGRVPKDEELRDNLEYVGWDNLVIDENRGEVGLKSSKMVLDAGGIAKGLAVDKAILTLKKWGITDAIVDAGGDLGIIGARPGKKFWRIGVQHPRDPGRLLLTLDLSDTAVVTSGDYERFFMADGVRYHHILDPATGRPARGCSSVTVIAPTAMEADACATAAFVLGPEKGVAFLRSRPGVRGLIVDAGGGLHGTDDALTGSAQP